MIRTKFVEANTVETLESKVNDLEAAGWRFAGMTSGPTGYVVALQRSEEDEDDEEGGTADAAIA